MICKAIFLSLLSTVVLASVPIVTMAYPDDCGRYQGYRHGVNCQSLPDLTEEQVTQLDKLYVEHRNTVEPLYEQLAEKRMELQALSPNQNVKPEELKAITAEIAKLHKQIRTVTDEFYAKMGNYDLPCPEYHHYGEGWRNRHPHGHGCVYWH